MRADIGVIFDMDGVLVDSGDAHQSAWQQLGHEVGVPFDADLFRRTFGQRNESIIPTWLGEVSADRVSELGDRKEVLYRALVRQGAVRVYARIPELLHELRSAGAALAVASSGPKENVALLIETIGGFDLIDAAISADDVTEGKPHPAAFLAAAKRLRAAPRRCAVVEDSVHGIEAAKRADMLAIAVLTSTAREILHKGGADQFFREVGEIDAQALTREIAQRG
jgi:HAD superfamily hydrolase (TIGR01509 family)